MTPQAEYILYLVNRRVRGEATEKELDELQNWVNDDPAHAELLKDLDSPEYIASALNEYNVYSIDPITARLKLAFPEMYADEKVYSFSRWIKYAAAIIILITAIALYYILSNDPQKMPTISQTLPVPKEIPPGTNHAILTLSSGQKIELDNAASETITDGSLSIKNTSGHLSYSDPANPLRRGLAPGAENPNINPSGSGAGVSVAPNNPTNTMTTPRGGQYTLTLSDGTKIWLNAASSITYPTTFTSKTREVKITGEAYLEVAQNKEKPFIVRVPSWQSEKRSKENSSLFEKRNTGAFSPGSPFEKGGKGDFEKGGHDDAPNEIPRGGFSITVLGTSFNVNAYPDEKSIKTSLLEGAIKVNEIILKPGQACSNNKIISTNLQQDVAWKNGLFNFTGQDFAASMRQLERWYDIQVVYDGPVPTEKFGGEINRNLSLNQLLKGLNGIVAHFKLEGKILHVLP